MTRIAALGALLILSGCALAPRQAPSDGGTSLQLQVRPEDFEIVGPVHGRKEVWTIFGIYSAHSVLGLTEELRRKAGADLITNTSWERTVYGVPFLYITTFEVSGLAVKAKGAANWKAVEVGEPLHVHPPTVQEPASTAPTTPPQEFKYR